MKERFLPIGTVLLLKNGTKIVMITSYCVFSNDNSAKKEMYEYGGCLFPEGVVDFGSSLVFNHNQINKILHMGYEDDSQKNFSQLINDHYEEVKGKYESGELSNEEILNSLK